MIRLQVEVCQMIIFLRPRSGGVDHFHEFTDSYNFQLHRLQVATLFIEGTDR